MTTQTSNYSFRTAMASLTRASYLSSQICKGSQSPKDTQSPQMWMTCKLSRSKKMSKGIKRLKRARFRVLFLLRQNRSKQITFSGTLKSPFTAADQMKIIKSLNFSRLILILKIWPFKAKWRELMRQSPPIRSFLMKAKMIIPRAPWGTTTESDWATMIAASQEVTRSVQTSVSVGVDWFHETQGPSRNARSTMIWANNSNLVEPMAAGLFLMIIKMAGRKSSNLRFRANRWWPQHAIRSQGQATTLRRIGLATCARQKTNTLADWAIKTTTLRSFRSRGSATQARRRKLKSSRMTRQSQLCSRSSLWTSISWAKLTTLKTDQRGWLGWVSISMDLTANCRERVSMPTSSATKALARTQAKTIQM